MQDKVIQVEQESYRILVENVKDYAIILLDPEGYITSWNKGAERIKGYTAEEIIGQNFSIFYTKEELREREPQKNLDITKKRERYETEGWRVRKDGTQFWASVVLTKLKDSNGQLIGYGKVTRDLTKRKMAEQEINRLNKELEAKLQQTESEVLDYKHALDEAAIVAITNQKGIIQHVNDNFLKISKYSREELIGQDHRIINSGYHPKEFMRNLWITIANGRIWRGEIRNRAKDGTFYWVDTTIVPFLNEMGKPYQYVAIRNDVTSRKEAEEQLFRINEELENKVRERTLELTEALEKEKELNEMKSRFVSMASHEFRTPLSAILSSISLIDHYMSEDQTAKRTKHIERIKSSVRNLTNILDDFLSLEKLEEGRVDIHIANFDLSDLVEDVIEEVEGMSKKKAQKINFAFTGDLEVRQDKKILRNVLLNLLSNAIKYSEEGKEISIKAGVSSGRGQISVQDEGIGIPAEAQKHLFSKFYRANNAVNIQGTGLGLHIVKRYLDLVKGSISFTSSENKGTTFTISFPKEID
jgi:PAS domain S-box-containing protein